MRQLAEAPGQVDIRARAHLFLGASCASVRCSSWATRRVPPKRSVPERFYCSRCWH